VCSAVWHRRSDSTKITLPGSAAHTETPNRRAFPHLSSSATYEGPDFRRQPRTQLATVTVHVGYGEWG